MGEQPSCAPDTPVTVSDGFRPRQGKGEHTAMIKCPACVVQPRRLFESITVPRDMKRVEGTVETLIGQIKQRTGIFLDSSIWER